MACYSPLTAFQAVSGEVFFVERSKHETARTLFLPCGQCVGCRLERSRQWAMRCVHEASLFESNCFITLTYSEETVPSDGSLRYVDFQLFMKRLRKRFFPRLIRFYMCGEYGEKFQRPHFHACLFNLDFSDKVLLRRSDAGSCLYRSPVLEVLWPFGFSSIGELNFESAAYAARYVVGKVTGACAVDHYARVDRDTGELRWIEPEFSHMSLKPGVGRRWIDRYERDVFPHDYVVIRGRKVKPPKYYDRIFAAKAPEAFQLVAEKRERDALSQWYENTDARLSVRRQVAVGRLAFFKRGLDNDSSGSVGS